MKLPLKMDYRLGRLNVTNHRHIDGIKLQLSTKFYITQIKPSRCLISFLLWHVVSGSFNFGRCYSVTFIDASVCRCLNFSLSSVLILFTYKLHMYQKVDLASIQDWDFSAVKCFCIHCVKIFAIKFLSQIGSKPELSSIFRY